jgi:lysyl-tRNA synthetase class 2
MASLEEIRQTRLDKLQALKDRGIDPYPVTVKRDISVVEARQHFDVLASSSASKHMAGRILSMRAQGKIIFLDFDDGTGKLQALLKENEPLAEDKFKLFHDYFDIGDFVELHGTFFVTNKGEQTLLVDDLKMLSKSLRPLPEKWHGLTDVEARFRERELDVISDKEVKDRFIIRSKAISAMRRFLDDHGFLEFETPVLHPIAGGANARPFVTHHNALDIDMYLRIATEIYLKRLIVAGFNKVYEIGRIFRNEGIDHAHNPEFTMLEMYWAYASKDDYIDFLEDLMRYIIKESKGTLEIDFRDRKIDFGKNWPVVSFRQAILEKTGIDIDEYKTGEELEKAVREKGLDVDFSGSVGVGDYLDTLFKKTARPEFVEPTWILDYPVELKPLANASPQDPTKSASLQLIVDGNEIINAYYHELNNALEQRKRFEEQEGLREKGSEDAQRIDEEFLTSMEYGMPPTSGVGIGIDRLVMLLTNTDNIKEVILFPTLRPKN